MFLSPGDRFSEKPPETGGTMAAHADLVPKSGIKFAKDQRFKDRKAEGPESFLGHKDLVANTAKFGSGSRFEPERPATT
eukprot:76544-Amorphochlora_amoeboformis.AAC.1